MEELNLSIGGYFGLELNRNNTYHNNALALNTGRNALEYILRANNYKTIYLPYFTCDVLLEPIKKLDLKYEFYNINEKLEPIFEFSNIIDDCCFLYTNYFGLKDDFVNFLSTKCKHLIVDNAQSFYSEPIKNIDTFYSVRKFFGVSDGSYVYCNKKVESSFDKDYSYERFDHLLKRIDLSAEGGYSSFTENDKKLVDMPILHMSNLTKKLLQSIDYDSIADKRIKNYLYLDKNLKSINRLQMDFSGKNVPMVYPFWSTKKLRTLLLEQKIYVAKYWPNVSEWCDDSSLEVSLSEEVSYLPIDQRYSWDDMAFMIEKIKEILKYA